MRAEYTLSRGFTTDREPYRGRVRTHEHVYVQHTSEDWQHCYACKLCGFAGPREHEGRLYARGQVEVGPLRPKALRLEGRRIF